MLSLSGDALKTSVAICALLLVYILSLAIYRLFLHPLSRFPGPKLAALSKWYEFYYDVYLKGVFVFKLDELHRQYGPIVRITPDEIHISDPDFYTEYFTKSGPQSKYDWMANRFNNPTSVFSTIPPDHHKLRRGALESMFSRQQIRKLLPVLQERVAEMLSRLREYETSQKAVRLDRAMFALSEDMIFEYAFGISRNALDKPDFEDPLHEVFVAAGAAGALSLQFPIVPKILNSLPDSLILKLQPDFLPLVNMRRGFVRELDMLEKSDGSKTRNTKLQRTVMLDLYNDPDLPAEEKTRKRLLDEAQLIIGAGLSTTGWAATVGLYHILANPPVLERLRKDLFTLIPPDEKRLDCTDLDWAALEGLPYLQACIKESLRLSYGMSARNARRTHKDLIYTESAYVALPKEASSRHVQGNNSEKTTPKQGRTWVIPAYTPVSMSIPLISHNEHIFPDSHKFNPDRWLGPSRVPDRYLVTFGKGSRQCLGMQLAWAELSLMLAGTLRWFDFELLETDDSCVKMAYDVTIPVPESTDGLKVKVKKELD